MNRISDKYENAGVKNLITDSGFSGLSEWIRKTFQLNPDYPTMLDLGYFANVIKISPELGIAISTDGVGTKVLVAEMMGKYDTIGIDLIAMNVNDIICVGAEPITLVDYIAVQKVEESILKEIAKGLFEGAKISRISIPGGEVAQMNEVIKGLEPDQGIDLVGTAVGLLKNRKPIVGQDVTPGDLIIGFSSSGLHSNGFTLLRKILFKDKGYKTEDYIAELGKTLGEELIEPTHIYVPEVMEILNSDINVKALLNITGDGIFNVKRIANKKIGFEFDNLFESKPIFNIIQKEGNIPLKDMFRIFNMGMGFCIVIEDKLDDVKRVIKIAEKSNSTAKVVGHITNDPENKIKLLKSNFVDIGDRFIEV